MRRVYPYTARAEPTKPASAAMSGNPGRSVIMINTANTIEQMRVSQTSHATTLINRPSRLMGPVPGRPRFEPNSADAWCLAGRADEPLDAGLVDRLLEA